MADVAVPVGPVDIAVIGFPERAPDAAVTAALAEAVVAGAVRVLDAVIVKKARDGTVTIIDVEEPEAVLDLLGYPADIPGSVDCRRRRRGGRRSTGRYKCGNHRLGERMGSPAAAGDRRRRRSCGLTRTDRPDRRDSGG